MFFHAFQCIVILLVGAAGRRRRERTLVGVGWGGGPESAEKQVNWVWSPMSH